MASLINGGANGNGAPAGAAKAKQRQVPAVVPVIPLPLMQRKQAAALPSLSKLAPTTPPASMTSAEPAAAAAQPTEKAVSVSVSPLESPDTVSAALSAAAANGAPPSPTSDAGPDKNTAAAAAAAAHASDAVHADENNSARDVVLESNTPSSIESPPTNATTPMPTEPVFAPQQPFEAAAAPAAPAPQNLPHAAVSHAVSHAVSLASANANANVNANAHAHAHAHARYLPPPAFQPVVRNGEGPRPMRLVLDRHMPMHGHVHAGSNGSAKLQFGGFPDSSNNPSPVPLPGGIAPPPGIPLDSRQGSGYGPAPHPGMQFPQDVGIDTGFGRHSGGGPFPHHISHFSPSTPHSFHGSQSSAQDDGTVFGASFTPGLNVAGSAAAADFDYRMFSPASHHHPGMMPPMPPPHMMHMLPPEADGLRDYVKGAFEDGLFRDCLLVLSLSNMKDAIQIAGHRLIFARSTVLRDLILHDRSGSPQPTIHLATDDRNVRPDSFFLAVRRIYGYDLFVPTAPPPPGAGNINNNNNNSSSNSNSNSSNNNTSNTSNYNYNYNSNYNNYTNYTNSKAATSNLPERFDYTLGYAASGHLLRWESVTMRGMEAAARMLEWPVLERALEFLLGGVAFRGAIDRESQLAYGEPSIRLMGGVIYFITSNLPANFVLDPSVDDPRTYARLPDVLGTSTASSPRHTTTIARGTAVHRPRLSHIKFGDMAAPASPVPHLSPVVQAILSRVLLNLPFIILEPILEQVVAGAAMLGPGPEARQQVVRDVMMEREARRLRVVDAVLGGRVPAAAGIKRGLQSTQPRTVDEWDVLGWVEELGSPHDLSLPFSLVRRWTPLRDIPASLDEQPMYP